MRRLRVRVDQPARKKLAEAAQVLRDGGIVAFPTETVYGICVDASNRDAVQRLYDVKGRDAAKACALLLPNREAAERHAGALSPIAQRLADRLWPGPVTLVVPGPQGRAVGLRLPAPVLPRALAAAAQRPLIQTSANLSGQPAALNAAAVIETFGKSIDLVLDGGRTEGGKSSTVVRCDGDTFAVVRAGAVPTADIIRAATRLVLFACTGNLCRSPVAEVAFRRSLADKLVCDEADLVRRGFRVGSFGTMAMAGHPASTHSITVAKELGLDLADHRSRPFSIGLLAEADIVYCMGRNHLDFLRPYFPGREDRVVLLDPKSRQIHDPYGRSLRVYRKTGQQIAAAIDARTDELLGLDDESVEDETVEDA